MSIVAVIAFFTAIISFGTAWLRFRSEARKKNTTLIPANEAMVEYKKLLKKNEES